MRKNLFGLASLLCAATLCVGGGAMLLNDDQTVSAETASTVHTWSTGEGMSFTADELWQMDQMLTEIPRTVEFCANIGSATKNTMVFSNFPTGSSYSYFAVRYINKSGLLDVFYTKTGSGSSQGFRSAATVLAEGYHTYSVVLGDNGGMVYVDGVLVDTTPVTYVSKTTYAETFTELPGGYNYCVGGDPRSGNSGYVNDGQIKWISAYSDVRTADEIAASQTTVNGADANLLFAYDLAEAKANSNKIVRNKGTANNPLVSSLADVWTDSACTDVADYAGADNYAFGVTGSSISRMQQVDEWHLQNNIGTDSIGIEFRYKADAESLTVAKEAYWTAKGYTETGSKYADTIIGVQLGTRVFELDWNPLTNVSRLNTRDVWNGWSGQTGTDKNKYGESNPSFNPLENEYYFRVLRVKHQWKDTYKYYFYMATVNADGTLGEESCVLNGYEDEVRTPKYDNASYNTISAYPLHIANSTSYPYTATISSNKYVGIKTTVDGVDTVEKVTRGSNFTLADLTEGTTVHAGWSKGAETYSAADYVANVAGGVVLENVQTSASYRALTMRLEADKAASIRFRKRGENPLEISLKWNVTAEDSSNLGYYFGGIKFGYVLTASNGVNSGDIEVANYTNGYTEPYGYGIIQSNIGEASYTVKFTCQAYVELNGVKYYTAAADMENDGRSVDIVADRATADLRSEITTENGVAYSNAIKNAAGEVIGYHYLTQEQYDLVATAGAKNA